jgi:O-antigen ligase
MDATPTISVYPFATITAFFRLVCYVLVFLTAIRNYQVHKRQPFLVVVLVGLGIFEAAYGILQYTTGFPYIFLYKKSFVGPEATGTYINRNHYAGLLAMCLPFLAARTLRQLETGEGGMGFLRKIVLAPQSPRLMLDAFGFCTVLVGLLFSLSRAGIAAGFLGLCVTGAVMLQKRRRSALGLLIAAILLTGSYAAWIGLGPLASRVSQAGGIVSDAELRMAIWRDTFKLIYDSPLLGTGLGTYEFSSLHYQSALLSTRYEHAHNDVLETAADLGIPLALVVWMALVVLLISLCRKAPRLHHSSDRVLASGCAGAITAILLHSLFDFNLQIPANALVFAWICGSASALVHRRSQRSNKSTTIDVTTEG